MRIGIDVSLLSSQYDGIGTYIYNQLVYFHESDEKNQYFLYSNLPLVKDVPQDERFIMRTENHRGHLRWLLTVLPSRIRKDKIDVFWQPNFIFPYRISGTKSVVTVHDLSAYSYTEFSSVKANITHKLLLKPTCHKADRILAISNACKEEIIKCLQVDAGKITTIYNGKKMFSEEPLEAENMECLKKYKLEKNGYLLFVGTLSPRKNDEVIANAYLAYRQHGGKKKIVFAGSVAEKSRLIKEKLECCAYSEDIVFTGYVTDAEKQALYYQAAMLLYPSRLEGFGLPLLEAMQAKIPVITAAVSSMPEIAQDAAIYLNNIDDAKELAQRIFQVEQLSQEERQQLIEKGLARVAYFDKMDYRKLTLEAIQKT